MKEPCRVPLHLSSSDALKRRKVVVHSYRKGPACLEMSCESLVNILGGHTFSAHRLKLHDKLCVEEFFKIYKSKNCGQFCFNIFNDVFTKVSDLVKNLVFFSKGEFITRYGVNF